MQAMRSLASAADPPTLPADVPSLNRVLFASESFGRDHLPERLTIAELQRSLSHEGDLERLQRLLDKLRSGQNVTVGVVGGSVSAGSSSAVRADQGGLFHKKIQKWLQRRFPAARISHFNAAMPAVPPNYMQHCLRLHVPAEADLVFLEGAANMCGPTDKKGADACGEGRASVERMLRQLLRYPRAPAVVLVHVYPYWNMVTPKGWSQKARRSKRGPRAGLPAPPAVPWLVPDDLRFEFHRQWGHGTHEHMLDELAKYPARVAHRPGPGRDWRAVPLLRLVLRAPATLRRALCSSQSQRVRERLLLAKYPYAG